MLSDTDKAIKNWVKRHLEDLSEFFYYYRQESVPMFGLGLVALILIMCFIGPYIVPYPQDAGKTVKLYEAFQPPSLDHFFGTDENGRDVFSRVIIGAGISISIAFEVIMLVAGIGILVGLIAGFTGGWIYDVLMRITDTFLAVPPIALAIIISAALGPSTGNMIFAVAASWWTWYARLAAGETLSVKEELYIEASRSLGASSFYMIFKEILPNILGPILIMMTLDLGNIILVASSLSFLGLGTSPPTPEWGLMIAEGRKYLPHTWWSCVFPALALLMTAIGFNFIGDGLRDVYTRVS